jgi:glycerol-3-phosphate O-acyltransferase / dihydroxyacetone phosphate acyltransferase
MQVSRLHRTRRTADPPLTPSSHDPPREPPPESALADRPTWWRRHLHRIFAFIARTYYQVRLAGSEVPAEGPVLLVSNHPNSLMDAPLLALAAGRPVRFLAGAHLFRRRSIAWAVRGSGAIPVFRRSEEPGEMGRNTGSFTAVRDALLAGSAVGVFPEGFTHSEPALAPLKTGAARIALFTAAATGRSIPILPVGITFRGGKERFRSEALVLVGKPVRWADLTEDATRPEHVRELTQRIESALGRVIVNLSDWEDLPLVEVAEAVHEAEFGRSRTRPRSRGNPVRWLARMRRTAQALERARERGDAQVEALHRDLGAHARVLGALGLTPRDLHTRPRSSVAVRWTLGNLFFFGLALPLAAVGTVVFWLPWTIVQRAEPRFRLTPDRRATYRVLAGTVTCGLWVMLLAALAMEFRGWRPAMALLIILPLTGFLTLRIRTRWRTAVADLRRFLFLRARHDVRTGLLVAQRDLAVSIRELQNRI